MPSCEMCGAETHLFKAIIENTKLKVCKNCAKYGKILGRFHEPKPKEIKRRQQRIESPEIIELVVENYSALIKKARERRGLKQEEIAKKIAEKESLIQKIESGQFKPSISLAQKIGRFLNIKLIEEYEDKPEVLQRGKSGALTIGDMIKVRKR